jgi:S-DNA-T family DNA segregation ATPase FtsK/SpoIIIE
MKSKRSGSSAWGRAFILGLGSLTLMLALGSYHPEDPSFSSFSSDWQSPKNVLGYFGSWIADGLLQLLGYGAWALPALLFVAVVRWMLTLPKPPAILALRWWAAFGLLCLSYSLAADLVANHHASSLAFPIQGLLGIAVSAATEPFFGQIGSALVVAALIWCFCMLWWEDLPQHVVNVFHWIFVKTLWQSALSPWIERLQKPKASIRVPPISSSPATEPEPSPPPPPQRIPLVVRSTDLEAPTDTRPAEPTKKVTLSATPATRPTHWETPPLSLLEATKKKARTLSEQELRETALKIQSALRSFEIDGEIVEISPGPIITMYEFSPAPGVRVQKLMSASTDLAMSLGAPSIRIVAPIPGKTVAGIEVPNVDRDDIVLRDCFDLTQDKARSMRLPLILGKDGQGKPVAEDLSRMPHLLIGGATSMGKSVLVNSILTGLLMRFSPEELRLIIVDPKLVEFKIFEDIPHLLLPIVNDPSDASQALKWAVGETKRRYLLMQKHSAKNIEAFNAKVPEHNSKNSEPIEKLPYVVIIIDELAELMLTAKKEVENSIIRLTQLARAAGIHLIMATQRPSADIITGLIKSNCPSRAALRVASSSDSRIILDGVGAEQLLGRGDMFFTNTGVMGMRRMQSPFVSDGEIEKVCDFWRNQGEPEYREDILAPEPEESAQLGADGDELDSLYNEVIEFAREKGKISTSLIQRRFKLGYTRAARIMEQLEAHRVVGEAQAAGKPRDVLL